MSHTLKNIIYILLLLSLIIGAAIYTTNYFCKSSSELDGYLQRVEKHATDGDWELAQKEFLLMEDRWKTIKKTWATLTDHIEIDTISMSMSKASKSIELKDLFTALEEISVLKSLIKDMPQKDIPNISNIF